MKNPSSEIRIEYVNRLLGTILLGTQAVKVYDGEATQDAVRPYVILTIPRYEPEGRNKDLLIYEDFKIQLDIISAYHGQKEVDLIEQKILDIICPQDYESIITLPSFDVGFTSFESENLRMLRTDTGVQSRKILKISHNLTQK